MRSAPDPCPAHGPWLRRGGPRPGTVLLSASVGARKGTRNGLRRDSGKLSWPDYSDQNLGANIFVPKTSKYLRDVGFSARHGGARKCVLHVRLPSETDMRRHLRPVKTRASSGLSKLF